DDLDATVVVARKRGVRRVLVLDDGRRFSLSGASVVIGRNPTGEPAEHRLAMPDTPRPRALDKTVVTPRPTDDDLDATVVVARKRGVRRVLVLDDGRRFSLSGASVVIGRNPTGEPAEHRLAMPDTPRPRALDKTVVTPRPTDDDLDATVVVARKRGVRRVLVLDDGRRFSLSGASVVIGRNPTGEPAEHRLAMPDTPRPRALDKTVVTPRPTDDDLDATVVVARKRGVRRVLVLDDGRRFSLSGASVVIGRNPTGEPGEQRLAIPDTTRTLSKTHARLVVQEDEWRLTDLHATNGVVVVADDGSETLLDAGESVVGTGRFILGEVGMHVVAERDS
ncbi:FHA domain-containing protein, partial [Microbacterium sp. HSID17254]|uniref:FHA domain-containing protein n=1 Tax=Microbacterium sp. HSID17254 TaxID=2419509 RepID=UPI000F8612B9